MTRTETSSPSTLSAGKYRLRQLRVVLCPGAVPASLVTLDREPLAIGREPDGPRDLTLADGQASRLHARVAPEADGWVVLDADSRNGLFVDGQRVARAPLVHGTVIRIGQSLLVASDLEVAADAHLEPESDDLKGQSTLMQLLRGSLAQVATRDLVVLILGESGSGKERVAADLHVRSGRAGKLVAVNCAAITEDLAESELFGHAAGAFTGAAGRNDGLFVAAEGGTLFLDEIGELPPALQPKLLRALATGEIRPVGKSEARRVDVRVVAATNRDLAADVEAGRFRADLHARLSGWTISVPPLRARRDDVLRLARLFLDRAGGPAKLSANAAEALLVHDWPLNVRQLEQAVTAAAVKAAGQESLRRDHLPDELTRALGDRVASPPAPLPIALAVPRDATPGPEDLRRVVGHFRGNVARIADYFSKDRRQIYRWAERFGIDLTSSRAGDDE